MSFFECARPIGPALPPSPSDRPDLRRSLPPAGDSLRIMRDLMRKPATLATLSRSLQTRFGLHQLPVLRSFSVKFGAIPAEISPVQLEDFGGRPIQLCGLTFLLPEKDRARLQPRFGVNDTVRIDTFLQDADFHVPISISLEPTIKEIAISDIIPPPTGHSPFAEIPPYVTLAIDALAAVFKRNLISGSGGVELSHSRPAITRRPKGPASPDVVIVRRGGLGDKFAPRAIAS